MPISGTWAVGCTGNSCIRLRATALFTQIGITQLRLTTPATMPHQGGILDTWASCHRAIVPGLGLAVIMTINDEYQHLHARQHSLPAQGRPGL